MRKTILVLSVSWLKSLMFVTDCIVFIVARKKNAPEVKQPDNKVVLNVCKFSDKG